jgi:hypothetical protein
MKNKSGSFIFLWGLFCLALLMASCEKTRVSGTQVSDSYTGEPVSNILVIAVTGNEHNRRLFENTFVKQLKSVGVEAVASEKIMAMPPNLKIEKEAILAAVQQQNNDAVIISQLISGETKEVETRDGRSFRGFYYFSRSTTYSSTSTTLRLKTNLYDVKTQDRIWSVISDSWSQESTDKIISKVIQSVIGSMQKNKLITKN